MIFFEWDMESDIIMYSSDRKSNRRQKFKKTTGQGFAATIHPNDLPDVEKFRNDMVKGFLYSSVEYRIKNTDGNYVWYRSYAMTLDNTEKRTCKAAGLTFNINDEKQAMVKLKTRAEQDALTGLFNREETESQIKRHLLQNPSDYCALFMIDTDNFKQVNDSKGHMLGDTVLKEMAEAMKKTMRADDVVGRIGGDEFTIFMKNIPSREAAKNKAEKLSEVFRHLFEQEKTALQITCSIGVAVYPEDGKDFKTLYKHADQALYHAKHQGKNRYMIYDPDISYKFKDSGQSSLGTVIDSEYSPAESMGDILADIIRILYKTEDIDQAINLTLKVVGERFNVSRAYIFESPDNGKHFDNTYEWCSEGTEPQIQNLQNIDSEQAGDYTALFGDNSIFYCRDTSLLEPKVRTLLAGQGIYSTLQCAFWKGDEFAGFIGFDECTGLRLWTREEADILLLVSQMAATFLQKGRVMETNTAMQQQMRMILDSKDAQESAEKSIVECIRWLESSDYLMDGIIYVMEMIRDYYQSDRVYIIETDEKHRTCSNTYEICAEKVPPQIDLLQDVPIETISFWMKQFGKNGYIIIDNVDELEADRQWEREILKVQGVSSLMAVPLYVKDEMKGFLGVDNPKCYKNNFRYLKELSFFLGNEIAKNALKKKLEQTSYQETLTGLEARSLHSSTKQEYYKKKKELTKSFLNKEYLIYLQPKLNVKTGQVDSAEALVRYREKDGTILPPAEFIPTAERNKLISDIDFFVIKQVCCILEKWKDTPLSDLKLSLNLSWITMSDPHFLQQFLDIFNQYDISPGQLLLEIRGADDSINTQQMVHILKKLKQNGFCIVLDNFGSEYSPLEFLTKASFDILDIDLSIVQNIKNTKNGEILMRHTINMGHDIGAVCCAEGVETAQQFDLMKDIGCDYIQGYFIDRPLPAAQFEEKYKEVPDNTGL
ncbi:MAG: bifunctional diguanylate cyclase/phosphodiesterase [Eubacteriales bacterium]|nr:bifunctional diguanylate cyclase/phosphodiesterase [Eubacteriales bacterium]